MQLQLPNAHEHWLPKQTPLCNSWSVFFSVWLYHKGEFVGSGFTGEQRQTVHGYAVTPEEIVIQVECVTELHDHPRYGYPLEAGSFSTWSRVDVDFNKS